MPLMQILAHTSDDNILGASFGESDPQRLNVHRDIPARYSSLEVFEGTCKHTLGSQCSPETTLLMHLIAAHAVHTPYAPAIMAPGRPALTYDRLSQHLQDMRHALQAMGIGAKDRVALVLPNGPEMAVAFLSVAASATCAPLNPAYRSAEFEFYLSDLSAKALLIQRDIDFHARVVAQSRGIPIIEISPRPEAEAGLFTLAAGFINISTTCCWARAQPLSEVGFQRQNL